MRNSKVRKRIAAGKLRLRLRDLRNLGPRSESLLARIGIHTPEQLRKRGALNAFLAMKRAGVTNSLNALWALIGALEPWPEGSDWRAGRAGPNTSKPSAARHRAWRVSGGTIWPVRSDRSAAP